ncbi:MAG: SDR family oxidoreductase [Acidimicrobiales bacterium]
MEIQGKVVVVTGAASGIGRAMSIRFGSEAAAGVVVADVNESGATEVALAINEAGGHALAVRTDVSSQADLDGLVARAEQDFGPIDLFCSNAGIATGGGVEVDDQAWQRIWEINVMAHVRAARAVLPGMLARGEGYLLNTASAAGLLTNLGAAPYSVTKHAAVGLAEWLAITHGDAGIKVSCLCPQGVRTPMLLAGLDAGRPAGEVAGSSVLASGGMLEPEDVAQAVIEGLARESFFILPHPEVSDYVKRKAADPDRWLGGMRRLQGRLSAG